MEDEFIIPKWDYIELSNDQKDYFEQIQELGKKGWEVCGIIPQDIENYSAILLKRQSGFLRCERK